ncbi:MAG TPA: SDR family NAD(P)-dependent oxidoreductase, partial [Anaerovoracaceae bacterium]|nr:SDR family NAD(P)-dependent oxidoreductase [Anaerovoracaceae bacterium]
MDYGLKGKVALVIGGGGGSGSISSMAFAKEGCKVVVADRVEESGLKTVELIKADGGEAVFVQCDVTNEADIKAAVELAESKYGALNIALNIVGTNTAFTATADVPSEQFDIMFNINTRSTFYGMKHEIEAMKKVGGGSIVNMSSVGGLVGQYRQGLYNATKFAVTGMTKSAALDYA